MENSAAYMDSSAQRASQALRLEALGLMTAGITHDLGNMVQVLASAIHILERSPEVRFSAALEPVLSSAITSLDRTSGLVNEILGFVRREPPTEELVDVALLLAGMERMMRWLCPPPIKIRLALDSRAPALMCPRRALENALLNLVLNARDALPNGGEIFVSLEARLQDARPELLLTVADNGLGMAAEVLERAFDPLFTTKPAGQGSGLGLPMVRRFAQDLGGSVALCSSPACGTAVMLRLPVSSPLQAYPHQGE